ncbi:MAG: UvrD-helicase domain-containing protein [Butyricicoccus pullicaecorum]
MRENNALDFDDIIMKRCSCSRIIQIFWNYQRKFRYVLVDEYQDTNHAQYVLTSLLAGGYQNICVVGDDDQSIYKFCGATITNILNLRSSSKMPALSVWSRITARPIPFWMQQTV